jgi:hypothetical protein
VSELKLITCICPAPAGQVCPVSHDFWLRAQATTARPYPCRCDRGCDPNWCECAGRVDLHAVPSSCCAKRNTPEVVARAKHGGDYRPCWCGGRIERHKTETAIPAHAVLRDTVDEDEDEED